MTIARDAVVYVVAKAPRAGASKTRLCPPLRPPQAARLAEAFLLDTVALARRAGCRVRVICRDAAEQATLERIVADAPVCVQAGAGLGAALESAFSRGLADGAAAVAVLGADSPTLPPARVREAFAALARGADVALGPSDDGGYYLLAARALHPTLFRDMAWSTSTVAQVTLERCRAAGLRPYLLPRWYDVDDVASLVRLRAELARAPVDVAPRTRSELAGRAARGSPPASAAQSRSGGIVA